MSWDWTGYRNLALELSGRTPTAPVPAEARIRSAISRAYYAAFHLARRVAERKDHYWYQRASGRTSHDDLIHHYQHHGDPVRLEIGLYLETMRDLRIQADYHDWIAPRLLPTNAAICAELSGLVLALVGRIV